MLFLSYDMFSHLFFLSFTPALAMHDVTIALNGSSEKEEICILVTRKFIHFQEDPLHGFQHLHQFGCSTGRSTGRSTIAPWSNISLHLFALSAFYRECIWIKLVTY